jgi:ribosomal RNA methyltransferase Nop2
MSKLFFLYKTTYAGLLSSDNLLRGPTEELDLGSDDSDSDEPPTTKTGKTKITKITKVSKTKKSKQLARPTKIIPTHSDQSSNSSSSSDDDDDRITMANMEARSRKLDEQAQADAALDAEEMQDAALGNDEDDDDNTDMDGDEDEEVNDNDNVETEPFRLLTLQEREEEKKRGGPDVHLVQRRMRECVRVLSKFRKLAGKGQ